MPSWDQSSAQPHRARAVRLLEELRSRLKALKNLERPLQRRRNQTVHEYNEPDSVVVAIENLEQVIVALLMAMADGGRQQEEPLRGPFTAKSDGGRRNDDDASSTRACQGALVGKLGGHGPRKFGSGYFLVLVDNCRRANGAGRPAPGNVEMVVAGFEPGFPTMCYRCSCSSSRAVKIEPTPAIGNC